jgi:hypothetical protein
MPHFVTKVEIQTNDDSVKALHIHLGFKRGSKFKDELGEKCSIHDTPISFALFSRVIQSWR